MRAVREDQQPPPNKGKKCLSRLSSYRINGRWRRDVRLPVMKRLTSSVTAVKWTKGHSVPKRGKNCCASNKDATPDVTIITAGLVIVILHYHLMQWGKKSSNNFQISLNHFSLNEKERNLFLTEKVWVRKKSGEGWMCQSKITGFDKAVLLQSFLYSKKVQTWHTRWNVYKNLLHLLHIPIWKTAKRKHAERELGRGLD